MEAADHLHGNGGGILIGAIARKHLSQHREGAVDRGGSVSACYTMAGFEHVDGFRIERLIEQLVNELVTISACPGAEAASTLGLITSVEHPEAGRIIVTLSLSGDGRDVGCCG